MTLIKNSLLFFLTLLMTNLGVAFSSEDDVIVITKPKPQASDSADAGQAPKNATLVKVTASSTQNGHPPDHAIDASDETRWCASGGSYPQWLQLEFEQPHMFTQISISWQFPDSAYQYKVEGSADGQIWTTLLDASENSSPQQGPQTLAENVAAKFVRITGVGGKAGWCSVWNLNLQGQNVGPLWPADPKSNGPFASVQIRTYVKSGNNTPSIEKLTAQQEDAILNDVKVPAGFDVTVFAAPPAVNYPVFVAATVDGTVFVSSDGNGSLGRDPERGRVIRLRDLDGDGRADETKIFCEIDSPRGLVWDHDRLFLMHPPHLSAFVDNDGDGVADEQKILVKNLAFGYDKRPADHTTNGVSLGVDGWLYIAGGDFGFIDAEGRDGRKLTHRGGGVIRVRPDGTGLEVYSTGTRNILEVAISPQMDLFARDNTNDGGGWDVRLHHFTGMEDHGYPRLYKNFNDECVQPLADYGGGSGCGAVYIDEPGFGKWNNAPFTADWGTGSLYRHTVTPKGATFSESAPPESFIKMTRPTDADVDGNSHVYCASWRGATFKWAGTDVGYLVSVKPKDYQPAPMPNFATATTEELVEVMKSNSHRRRMEAQRELKRRGQASHQQLLNSAVAKRSRLRNLLERLKNDASDAECIEALANDDSVVQHTAIRCLAKRNASRVCFDALDKNVHVTAPVLRALAMMHETAVVDGLITRLPTATAPKRGLILSALCRLHFHEGVWKGDSWGTRPDTRGPYYQPEPWSETSKIADVLDAALKTAAPNDAAVLVQDMHRNRIESDDALKQMLKLAESNDELLATAVAQLATLRDIPTEGIALLLEAAVKTDAPPVLLSNTIGALAKLKTPEVPAAMLAALTTLDAAKNANKEQRRARRQFSDSQALELFVDAFESAADSDTSSAGLWADAALLSVASRKNASPEPSAAAKQAVDNAWQQSSRRVRLMQAAAKMNNHWIDEQILAASDDTDATVASTAKSVIKQLKIKASQPDNTPRINTISVDEAATQAVARQGDVSLGQQIFKKASCVACHTVSKDEVQKGPFLGNIAKTYKRTELAYAVLVPSKTIAQGFVTNVICTDEGKVYTGFVSAELSDRVTLRDAKGKEITIQKDEIEERATSTVSVMPKGVMAEYTVHEFASLLDYIQSLAP